MFQTAVPFEYVPCDPSKISSSDKDKKPTPDSTKDKKAEFTQAKVEMQAKWISKYDC